jgi:hypothetical protein
VARIQWQNGGMPRPAVLQELNRLVARHAGRDSGTIIDGLLVSRHERSEPDYELAEPLFVLMIQGGKRL